MKKRFIITLLILVLATAMICLVACDGDSSNSQNNGTTCGGAPRDGSFFQKDTDVLAFGAASSGEILEQVKQTENTGSGSEDKTEQGGNTVTYPDRPQTDISEKYLSEIEAIKGYVDLVENFLGSDPMNITEKASDREGYQKMLSATNKDMVGNDYSYVIYYNETEKIDPDRDFDDIEKEYIITGIMVDGDNEYELFGKKEVEGAEFEIEFTVRIDAGNYVKIKQEVELGEHGLEYEVYRNGVLVDSFELEVGFKESKTEVEMKTVINGIEKSFEFEKKQVGNRTYIEVETVENGVKTKIEVYATINAEGVEEYTFVSGEVKIKKPRH